jgi:hypothetical protein
LHFAEDIFVAVGDAEAVILSTRAASADVATRFRLSTSIRALDRVDEKHLGIALEDGDGQIQGLLVGLDTGEIRWRTPLSVDFDRCKFTSRGVVMTTRRGQLLYASEGQFVDLDSPCNVTAMALDSAARDIVDGIPPMLVGSDGGAVKRIRLEDRSTMIAGENHVAVQPVLVSAPREEEHPHTSGITALAASGSYVLSAGADGSLAMSLVSGVDQIKPISTAQRRLHCVGARVDGVLGERQLELLLVNGARAG